jgi:hypothetical protein
MSGTRSSITEQSFHGLSTSCQVFGQKCNRCVRYVLFLFWRLRHLKNALNIAQAF